MAQYDYDVDTSEYIAGGHSACAGCGGSLALRMLLKVMGPKTVL
ncbi:MAG: pyruvate ferredoxin oxidoreductase, partial [Betaproteobacteria bacterium]